MQQYNERLTSKDNKSATISNILFKQMDFLVGNCIVKFVVQS